VIDIVDLASFQLVQGSFNARLGLLGAASREAHQGTGRETECRCS